MIHEEISGKIISAAMEMLNELKLRLDEKLYERAMINELSTADTLFQCKGRPRFLSRGINWQFHPYLIVDDTVIVDPKVVSCFTYRHIAQMIRYLNITRLKLALINSKNARLEWKRVLRPQEPHPKYFRVSTLGFIPRPGFSRVHG